MCDVCRWGWGGDAGQSTDMALSLLRRVSAARSGVAASVLQLRLNISRKLSAPSQDAHSKVKDWKLGRLNHVAIAVPNLERAMQLYRDVLGADISDVVPLPDHGVYTVFVNLGNTKIELLHPLGDKSPIESFLKKKPSGGMHHICVEVDDIRKAIRDLEGKIRPLNAEPQIGAHGKPVVFLHPKDCDGVLIELEET